MKRFIYIILAAALAFSFSSCSSKRGAKGHKANIIFGINADNYTVERKEVASGESWGKILGAYGIGTKKILRLDQLTKDICPLRTIRAGAHYTTFTRQDSTSVALDHLVYEKNIVDYVVFSFVGDSVAVREGQREVEIRRKKSTAVISSSLWGAIMEADLPYSLASEMEDIYQWTVDFFAIQPGDSFTVIYDEKFVDGESVGIGRIWGAEFTHGEKQFYAIPYAQEEGKLRYWEANGESLRKQLLKAPLKYTRISSKFSRSRLHPVHRVYRPHLGIDYAAPSGTPVHSVADGTVIFCGWGGGGGNTIKIKHAGGLETGYLHLQKFASGIKVGTYVTQGQTIGYVGSTGTSTGPHLDYRIWKNGTPVNPLKMPQEPAEPIKAEYQARFEVVRDRVIAELEHRSCDSLPPIGEEDIYPNRVVQTTVAE